MVPPEKVSIPGINLPLQCQPPVITSSLKQRDLAMECGDAGRFANASNLLSQS